MPKHYEGHEFEALKMRYEDQVELLRNLTQFDFRLFVAFFTLQLALGSWLAAHSVPAPMVQWGLAVIDTVLAALSIKLLHNQRCRRKEVQETVKNVTTALGFNEPGVYLEGQTLNPPYERRLWFNWYVIGVITATAGLFIILFRP